VQGDASSNRRAAGAGEVGVVVIGRNEGERLVRCIMTLLPLAARVVYVDSNSNDGSPAWARAQGVDVVELDMDTPFTAARARNAGYRRLREIAPNMAFVQFVDGDCELVPAWLAVASEFLRNRPGIGAVCGRLRERFPQRSVYNRLCDQEWDSPAGRARSCGGIAMMRIQAFEGAGGFRDDLIAGEEPELCVRLRHAGWEVWRLADEMALHDAAMLHFSQWWKRARRGGHAFAEGVELHGAPPERHYVVETRRALLWGLIIPVVILALALVHPGWLLLVFIYPLQVLRLALRDGMAGAAARWRALFLVIARFPEAQGVLLYWFNRLRRRRSALIEYK
jgi:glycosyltransferase involved in cell wall biosynthesis